MAEQMKVGVKVVLAILVTAVLFGGLYLLKGNKNVLDKILPKGKTVGHAMTEEAKKAAKSGTEVIRCGINTWGGYAPGVYYNNGLAATTNSRYYQDGVLVEFVKIEDISVMREAWKAGEIDVMGLATTDSLPTEIASLMDIKPKQIIQTDYSRGGDAVVVVKGINSVKDFRGKKIAVALGSPSHSLLLLALQAGEVDYSNVTIVGTDSGIAAAKLFKDKAVDIAVVWSPDDEDCIAAIPGSKVLFNTKKATNAIADVLIVKEDVLNKKKDALKKFVNGWLIAAGEINSNRQAKQQAAQIFATNFGVDDKMATLMIDNARLSTFGDNMQFFGLASGGVKGEEIYNKMTRLFGAINLAPANVPSWRSIVDTSILSSLSLAGPANAAEGTVRFAAPTAEEYKKTAFAQKKVQVQYAFNSDRLTEDGKTTIDVEFSNTAKEFRAVRVRIEGNTDSVGTQAYNKALSLRRAKSVADYLVNKYGFDKNRFVILGHGSDNPVPGCEDNKNEECRAKNRRTEFFLLD